MENSENLSNKYQPYYSSWDYIDDQIKRVFLIQQNQFSSRRVSFRGNEQRDYKELEKIKSELSQINEQIEHRLFQTIDNGISQPFIEEFIQKHNLNDFERFILFKGIASFLHPDESNVYEYECHYVKSYITAYTDNTQNRIHCRNAFYKDSKLIKLGIILVEPYWGELDDARVIFQTSFLIELLEFPNEKDKVNQGTNCYRPTVKFENCIHPEHIKERLLNVVSGYQKLLEEGNDMDALTILIEGLPGVGKTHLIDGLNNKIRKEVYFLNFPSLGDYSAYVLRSLAQTARNHNGVLFFDDAEAIFQGRNPQILTEIEKQKNIIIFLSTNNPDVIKPEMKQRFSFHLSIDLPSKESRKQLWQYLKPQNTDWGECVDIGQLSERFINISGRTIKNALKIAHCRATENNSNNRFEITLKDIEDGLLSQTDGSYIDIWGNGRSDFRFLTFQNDKMKEEFDEIVHLLKQNENPASIPYSTVVILLFGDNNSELQLAVQYISLMSGKVVRPFMDEWIFKVHQSQIMSGMPKVLNREINPDELLWIEKAETYLSEDSSIINPVKNVLVRKLQNVKGTVLLTTTQPENIDQRVLDMGHYFIKVDPPDLHQRKQIWKTGLRSTDNNLTDDDILQLASKYKISTCKIDRAIKRSVMAKGLKQNENTVITRNDLEKAVQQQETKRWLNDGIGY